jgi:hypothetical protein
MPCSTCSAQHKPRSIVQAVQILVEAEQWSTEFLSAGVHTIPQQDRARWTWSSGRQLHPQRLSFFGWDWVPVTRVQGLGTWDLTSHAVVGGVSHA